MPIQDYGDMTPIRILSFFVYFFAIVCTHEVEAFLASKRWKLSSQVFSEFARKSTSSPRLSYDSAVGRLRFQMSEETNEIEFGRDDNESLRTQQLPQSDNEVMPAGGNDKDTEDELVKNAAFEEADKVDSVLLGTNQNSIAWNSILLLNFVAILWGTQHSVIKSVVDDDGITPSAFSLFRFLLSALIASPYTPSPKSMKTWRWGVEMGFYMFAGYAMQAIGLQYTTAQKSGFLLYLNVKFVPILNTLIFGRNNNNVYVWLSASFAFVGTALLAYSPNQADGAFINFDWNIGDLWSIGAAVASAMYIIRLESASQQLNESEGAAQLNAASLWSVSALCFTWELCQNESTFSSSTIQHLSDHIYPILYLSFVATALANYIQTVGQRNLTAERASIIYAMDPVYGAIFSYLLLGEKLSEPWGIVGAAMITLAAASNAFLEVKKQIESNEEQ